VDTLRLLATVRLSVIGTGFCTACYSEQSSES